MQDNFEYPPVDMNNYLQPLIRRVSETVVNPVNNEQPQNLLN